MKKIGVALCCVFAFLGIIISGVKDAQAVRILINWTDKGVYRLDDPQREGRNNFPFVTPPAMGNNMAIIDIPDRTSSQLSLLMAGIGDPGSRRFVVKFRPSTQWIYNQMYQRGFVVLKWSQARAIFWDNLNNRFQTGEWRWVKDSLKKQDDCFLNCDAQACLEYGDYPYYVSSCECEEWQGRTFCHKKNFLTYSDAPDQR